MEGRVPSATFLSAIVKSVLEKATT